MLYNYLSHGMGFPLASEMCVKQLSHIFCLPLNMAFESMRSISQALSMAPYLSEGEKSSPTAAEALKHWFHIYIPKGWGSIFKLGWRSANM